MLRIENYGSVERDCHDDGGWFADFRIWIERPRWWRIPKCVRRAAPTCTLWTYDPVWRAYRLKIRPSWFVTDTEVIA